MSGKSSLDNTAVENEKLSHHYQHGDLLSAIESGVRELGKSSSSVTVSDLGAVDEFHVGGRQASIEFLDQLGLDKHQRILDIGCGLGGTARLLASHYQASVTGIDLCAEYVDTGNELCRWLGLDKQVALKQSSALDNGFEAESFDAACMLHVGMNIADKTALFTEIARVLKPGSKLGIYDVMRMQEGELEYPVPWASSAELSKMDSPASYVAALRQSSFEIMAQRSRRDFALEFFAELKKKTASTGRPALGLHILMGETAALKVKNMVTNISSDLLAPYEIIARRR